MGLYFQGACKNEIRFINMLALSLYYLSLVCLYIKVKFSHSTQFHKCITHEQYWDTGSCLSINFVSFSHVIFSLSNLLLNLSNLLGCYFSILRLSKVKYWSTSKEGMWHTWLLSSTKPQIYFCQCIQFCFLKSKHRFL